MAADKLVRKALELASAKRINQTELARLIGADPARFSEWKKGAGKPSLEQAYRMAVVLETSLDYLANDDVAEPPRPLALAEDERTILDVYRAFKLTRDEGIRALARVGAIKVATRLAVSQLASDSEDERARGMDGMRAAMETQVGRAELLEITRQLHEQHPGEATERALRIAEETVLGPRTVDRSEVLKVWPIMNKRLSVGFGQSMSYILPRDISIEQPNVVVINVPRLSQYYHFPNEPDPVVQLEENLARLIGKPVKVRLEKSTSDTKRTPLTLNSVRSVWPALIASLDAKLSGPLSKVRPSSVQNSNVVVAVDKERESVADVCDDLDVRRTVEFALGGLVGQPVTVTFLRSDRSTSDEGQDKSCSGQRSGRRRNS